VIVFGLSGAIKIGAQNFVGSMPAFGAQLDDASIAALATQLRKLQGATDASYTADEVKAERARPGGPPQTRQRRVQALGG
jgi:mono/diheme cytochrome c family protein